MSKEQTMVQKAFAQISERFDLIEKLLKREKMPYDSEVEYIESTGTQYIDTGVSCGPNTYNDLRQVICEKLMFSGATGSAAWSLNGVGTYSGCWFSGINEQEDYFYYGSGYANVKTNVKVGSENHGDIFEFDLDFPQNSYIVKNLSKSTTPVEIYSLTKQLPGKTNNLWIFGFGGDGGKHKSKIYSAKYYIGGILVRDYIPVRVVQTGYLFDRVSGQLFGNAGTGSFILGPDKS